jgi:alpha-glucosidase
MSTHSLKGISLMMISRMLASRLLVLVLFALPVALVATTASAQNAGQTPGPLAVFQSPSRKNEVRIDLNQGVLTYEIHRKTANGPKIVIAPSKLGARIHDVADVSNGLEVLSVDRTVRDEKWTQPWGQSREVSDRFNGALVHVRHIATQILFDVEFRAFDDGVAFRYLWPEQPKLHYFELDDEVSEFHLQPKDRAWWIPAFDDNRYEHLFSQNRIEELKAVHTPLTIELMNGLTISIHEARLVDYPSMALKGNGSGVLVSDLIPWATNIDAKLLTPHQSPWRTIQIVENQKELVESTLVLNLNDPSTVKDESWIRTGKFVGIWWGMQVGMWTWEMGPTHGATTANVKKYIDFASDNGFQGVLVEGWNYGWNGNWFENGDVFRFDRPYPDFDIQEVSDYAKSKNVKIVGHHETAAITTNYLLQIQSAFNFTERYGIDVIKTGHVGARLDRREWHHGQYGVNYYNGVMRYAAARKTMLVVHEPIKQTGLERTYPNLMATEGARGQEYDAWTWDYGNPPDHTTILPYTRLLAGPMDFTPGIFRLTFKDPRAGRVRTTLAKQLALYVIIHSPWQMVADLPENYAKFPKAFEFIKKVPTTWEETRGIAAQIGDYSVIARRDRASSNWYLGAITDEQARRIPIKLDFLEPNAWYRVNAYQDSADASWDSNPYGFIAYTTRVKAGSSFDLNLAPGGGLALEFVKE